MGAAVVPLVLTSTFVFDNVENGTSVSMTLVKRMPVFAWSSAVLAVRVLANTLVADSHLFRVQLVESAPTCEDPDAEFVGDIWDEQVVDDSDAPGRALFLGLKEMTAFADLAIRMQNVDPAGGMPAGRVTISVDMLVRGRSFDLVEYGDRDDERRIR